LGHEYLSKIADLDAVIYAGADAKSIRQTLGLREGPIVPLLMDEGFETWLLREQSICINTTAAGGDAALMAS
jgi:RHH-type proline utilization regulon transcriptional repressor/proline dehydrogenase/delta 1-pyrroline-5-carboxylate dehydrogenase